jgi:hypothetical protein
MAKDSVVLSKFAGLRNTVGEERLTPEELEAALNVDIDDSGALRRRRGTTKVAEGDYHSLYRAARMTLVVKNGDLVQIYPNYTTRTLKAGVGADHLAYCEVSDTVYYSSRTQSGVIGPDGAVAPWGTVGPAGRWLSPVLQPTDSLPAVRGKLLGDPPKATALAWYNGRIYLAAERTLWATELYLYDFIDKTRNYFYFEAPITALGAVTDGIFVGTDKGTYFMGGVLNQMTRVLLMPYGVMPGSMVTVPADLIKKESASKNAVLFLTEAGLCAGFDGGECYNLTQTRVIFPESERVAALFRRQDGMNQYVGVSNTGGTPTSSARIGDYVDAEIRRFQGV